jgi:triosephosphate isomerase
MSQPRSRTKLIVGNWKMNTTLADAYVLADGVRNHSEHLEHISIVLCPPSVWLGLLAEHCIPPRQYPHLKLGAQNLYCADKGAFTGEISPAMIKEVAEYVIVGHSERTHLFKEPIDLVAEKVVFALEYNLTPILCVGEEKKEPDSIRQVCHRLDHLVKGLSEEELGKIVVAYEPIWAIGTGDAASAEHAQAVASSLRQSLTADTRILYGGSVDTKNAKPYLQQPDIDGLLIGGASLKYRDFLTICTYADDLSLAQHRGEQSVHPVQMPPLTLSSNR